MSGETDLTILLGSMTPQLRTQDYVFTTVGEGELGTLNNVNPLGTFREQEGLTVIIDKSQADALSMKYNGLFKLISLTVHSSLEAVGLTAAVSSALAKQGISANVVAAFYHDHIFVPADKAHQALHCLTELAQNNR